MRGTWNTECNGKGNRRVWNEKIERLLELARANLEKGSKKQNKESETYRRHGIRGTKEEGNSVKPKKTMKI